MDVTPVLLGTLSGDHNTRTQAEEQIEMAKTNNLVRFVARLRGETPQNPAPPSHPPPRSLLPSRLAPLDPMERRAQPLLMSLLATELGNEGKEKHVRQAAGVQLKNCLVAKVSLP